MKPVAVIGWMARVSFAAALLAAALAPAAPSKRSLGRTEDFILFTGDQVPSLLGSEVRDLHLYACAASGFKAVPFQVDKRDVENRYVFPDEKTRDPMRDGTRLDANDEMVFMVRDAGDQCPSQTWPQAVGRGVEIELTDPLDQRQAWVYLWERPGQGPPQTPDYVSYRREGGEELVEGETYQLGQPLGLAYYDVLRLRQKDGSLGPDLMDRLRFGMKATLLNGAIPLYIFEAQIRSLLLGVIDGPVRVIRNEVDMFQVKSLGFESSTEYVTFYYPNGHFSPVEIRVPITLRKVFLDISIYYTKDFTGAILGSTLFNPANPRGILLDGRPDPNLDLDNHAPHLVVTGPQGTLVEVLQLDEKLLAQEVILATVVREDFPAQNSSQDEPGQILAGFRLKNTHRIERGNYQGRFYHYYPLSFPQGKLQEILNLIEHPVQITARPLAPAAP